MRSSYHSGRRSNTGNFVNTYTRGRGIEKVLHVFVPFRVQWRHWTWGAACSQAYREGFSICEHLFSWSSLQEHLPVLPMSTVWCRSWAWWPHLLWLWTTSSAPRRSAWCPLAAPADAGLWILVYTMYLPTICGTRTTWASRLYGMWACYDFFHPRGGWRSLGCSWMMSSYDSLLYA